MYWFKHDCGAIKDDEIQRAIKLYGGDGYMIFFGLLELVAEKMDAQEHPEPEAEFEWSFLRQTFHLNRSKIESFLNDFSTIVEQLSNNGSRISEKRLNFSYTISQEKLKIRFPNLLKRLDESFKKSRQRLDKVGTPSGNDPDTVRNKMLEVRSQSLEKDQSKDDDSILNFTKNQSLKIRITIADTMGFSLSSEATQNAYREICQRVKRLIPKNQIKDVFVYTLAAAKNVDPEVPPVPPKKVETKPKEPVSSPTERAPMPEECRKELEEKGILKPVKVGVAQPEEITP